MLLGGIFSLSIGLKLLSSGYRQYLKSLKTYYAITNKRALEIIIAKKISIKPISISTINAYEREDFSDGTGNLQLRETVNQIRDKDGHVGTQSKFDTWRYVDDVSTAAKVFQKLLNKEE